MIRTVPKSLSIVVVGIATVAQLGLAGIAWWSRRSTEEERNAERVTAANYAAQLATAQTPSAGAAAGRTPHPTLLASPDVAGTLRALQTIGDEVGITLVSLKAAQSTTVGRQTFVLSGRGTPDQLCAFVAGIEQSERLVVVEGGKVAPGSDQEVNFEMGLSTHHVGGSR